MDKSKGLAKQRMNKGKAPAPPGELIALGSKIKGDSEAGLSSKLVPASTRRDPVGPGGSLLTKKSTVTFTPLGRPTDSEKTAAATQLQYEELALDCPPAEFYDTILEAAAIDDEEKIERLLCGSVRYLKSNRAKPDNQLVLSIIYFAKAKPSFFMSDNVTGAFSSLLKRDPTVSFKAKGNPLVTVLACNVLYSAFAAEDQWPEAFVKVYIEDSMGERIWVDRPDCRCFADNIITAFGTRLPPRSMLVPDVVTAAGVTASSSILPTSSTSPSGTPRAASGFPDEDALEASAATSSGVSTLYDKLDALTSAAAEETEAIVSPRYVYQQDAIERQVLDIVSEHLGKRQPVDTSSRQLLKFLASTCGFADVRLAAMQKLEMWLQNPKLTRPAQDLLLYICFNCGQRGVSGPKDIEVVTNLLKLRVKTKQLMTHYLTSIRELLNQNIHAEHSQNLHTVVTITVCNELSNARNPNNMPILTTAFQFSPDKTPAILAEIFLDLLMNKEDYLRAIRGLLREIVRSARSDMDFQSFCISLMTDRRDSKLTELDVSLKERLFASITDLVAMSLMLCVTPAVREAATVAAKPERRDVQAIKTYWKQVANIQRYAVYWMQDVVPKLFEVSVQDYVHGLYKVLMMEPAESYFKLDNWPPEQDRHVLLRLATETPVLEETLMRTLLIGLTPTLPLKSADAIDVVDLMVRRAATAAANFFDGGGASGSVVALDVSGTSLIDLLFNNCAYHHPENIKLPKGYTPPSLAIATLYWKTWQILLILSAFNPSTFGRDAWESYGTLKIMMEMVMTNNYHFPPPTVSSDEGVIQKFKQKDKQIVELEKQEILEFEGHLAAATSKTAITEHSSVLLSLLITMDPRGDCRRPPDEVIESLKSMNKAMNLNSMLCRSRDPDFLMSVIERQGASVSMPWLADLVEASEGSLDVLPVQCLCEFLLHGMPVATATAILPSAVEDAGTASSSMRRKSSSSAAGAAMAARDLESTDTDKGIRSTAPAPSLSLQIAKQEKLLKRLRTVLFSPDPAAVNSAGEILDYFMQRLLSPSTTTRSLAVKGLSMVLSINPVRGGGFSPTMDVDVEPPYEASQSSNKSKFSWLLEDLPRIPLYDGVKGNVIRRLRKAVHVETDVDAIEAYLVYLSAECLGSGDQMLADTVEDISHIIVERSALVSGILSAPSDEISEPSARRLGDVRRDLRHALIALYADFTRRIRSPKWQACSDGTNSDDSEDVGRAAVEWCTGRVTVMSTFVVQAVVILLALCKPAMKLKYEDLHDAWFPLNARRPVVRAFPHDSETSEDDSTAYSDVVVYSDSLRLLMLQSGSSRLVESALEDVGLKKLLVFIQSFGIPKDSMTKLLQLLDDASVAKPEAVLAATRNRRDYLVRLMEVQLARGVEAGERFLFLLLSSGGSSTASSTVARPAALSPCVLPMDVADINHAPSPAHPRAKAAECQLESARVIPDSVDGVAQFIVKNLLMSRSQQAVRRRSCRTLQLNMAASGASRRTFALACAKLLSDSEAELVNTFWSLGNDVAPVLRLVATMARQNARDASCSKDPAAAAAAALFKALWASNAANEQPHGGLHSLVSSVTDACVVKVTPMDANDDIVHDVNICEAGVEQSVNSAMANLVLSNNPEAAARLCIRKIHEAESSDRKGVVGLLVDWLQTVDLEVVGHVSAEEENLLFGKRHGCQLDDSAACAPYLRAVLLHQTNWDTITAVISRLLDSERPIDSISPTPVLDFLSGCIHHPKLYMGRDRRKPKFDRPADVLGLSSSQVHRVAHLIVAEVMAASKAVAVECIDARIDLLTACCHGDDEKLKSLGQAIELRSSASCAERFDMTTAGKECQRQTAYKYLLIRLYSRAPCIARWLKDAATALHADLSVFLRGPCALDTRVHKAVTALGAAALPGRKNETALNDANLLCRKLAADHPSLFLRQLPMMVALLSGRCDFTFGEFKNRNHLLLFTHVFGIVELLQPQVFVHPSFDVFVREYFGIFKVHGQKALAPFFGKFVQLLHNFLHCAPARAVRILASHTNTLGYLCGVFPSLSLAKSLLSAVSLPQKELQDSVDEKLLTLPAISPPLTMEQLAPFRARLNKEASTDDVVAVLKDLDNTSMVKVDVLHNFIDDLKRLLPSENDECRNTAHALMMRYLRHNPSCARDFVTSYALCLEHENADVKKSALLNLAEFTVLSNQDDITALLQRAFVAAMKLDASESMTHVKEAVQLLHLENVQIV